MAVIASIEIKGVKETAMAFNMLPEEFNEVIDKELLNGIIKISNTAKEKCPYKTGTLRRSIRFGKGEEALEYLCGTDINYAEYIEYGTKPHRIPPIFPRFRKALKFEMNGETIFAKSTMGGEHPGTSPQPFLEPALFEHEDEINKNVIEAMKNKIKENGAEID